MELQVLGSAQSSSDTIIHETASCSCLTIGESVESKMSYGGRYWTIYGMMYGIILEAA